MDEELLPIGTFARRSWLSPKALRLYERQGLLAPAEVDAHNGYRWYREDQLGTARLVARLRRAGMPLAGIAEIVAAPDPATASARIAGFWRAEEARFAIRREIVHHVRARLLDGEATTEMYEIKTRDVPELTVLTEQRHVRAAELPAWIDDACGRLVAAAAGAEPGGPLIVIYHGEVNEDSDGPVEVCLPVKVTPGQVFAAPVRVEPAHREAYTRIIKAQVGYPQILSAFDAVAQWVQTAPVRAAGSPREVYFADFAGAGPEDEVCDIAYPVEPAPAPVLS